jgi:hypothetical protein
MLPERRRPIDSQAAAIIVSVKSKQLSLRDIQTSPAIPLRSPDPLQ